MWGLRHGGCLNLCIGMLQWQLSNQTMHKNDMTCRQVITNSCICPCYTQNSKESHIVPPNNCQNIALLCKTLSVNIMHFCACNVICWPLLYRLPGYVRDGQSQTMLMMKGGHGQTLCNGNCKITMKIAGSPKLFDYTILTDTSNW